jgi:hypothetical protein
VQLPRVEGKSEVKPIDWVVHEIETPGSWHATQAGHGHSQSYTRYQFDLSLLQKDYDELGDEPHVLYYLGTTYFAALEAKLGKGQHELTPEIQQVRLRGCVRPFADSRVDGHGRYPIPDAATGR